MGSARLLSLLHFADSALPTGGYAHSFGLEAYCQEGVVTDAAGVERFLRSHLEGAAGPCDATAAVAALRAFGAADLATCRELDATLEAMKTVREFREASRQMGRQTLRVAAALTGDAALGAYRREVDAAESPGHHAVAFGMLGGALRWEAVEMAAALLYSTTALLVGAALRLLPLGQLEGQQVLWRLAPDLERLAREAAARGPASMWSFAPGNELAGLRHERLAARLFRS